MSSSWLDAARLKVLDAGNATARLAGEVAGASSHAARKVAQSAADLVEGSAAPSSGEQPLSRTEFWGSEN